MVITQPMAGRFPPDLMAAALALMWAVLDGLADAGSGAWMIGQVTARRSDGMLVEVAR